MTPAPLTPPTAEELAREFCDKWHQGSVVQCDLAKLLTTYAEQVRPQWQPIETALKDGTPVLLKVKADLPGDRLGGVTFVGRNILLKDGFDIGWCFAAPVGYGGIPDEWLEGWQPLPSPLSSGAATLKGMG